MFSVTASLDVDLTKDLLKRTNGHDVSDLALIISVDGTPVGVATASFKSRTASIDHVGIIPEYRKQGYGDALTRTLLLKLSEIACTVTVNAVVPYYNRFGFVTAGDGMSLDVKDLVFPSACKHDHN